MKWVVYPDAIELMVDGRSIATVWGSGAWHTWDRDGVGGENASEVDDVMEPCPRSFISAPVMERVSRPNVPRAMKEAQASAITQGFHLGRSPRRSKTRGAA